MAGRGGGGRDTGGWPGVDGAAVDGRWRVDGGVDGRWGAITPECLRRLSVACVKRCDINILKA